MSAGHLNCVVEVFPKVQIVDDGVHGGGGDLASSGRANRKEEVAILGDDSWRHGRQRTASRVGIILLRGGIPKIVGLPGGGEIIHLVVTDNPGGRLQVLGPKAEVDRGGERNGHAVPVRRGQVARSVRRTRTLQLHQVFVVLGSEGGIGDNLVAQKCGVILGDHGGDKRRQHVLVPRRGRIPHTSPIAVAKLPRFNQVVLIKLRVPCGPKVVELDNVIGQRRNGTPAIRWRRPVDRVALVERPQRSDLFHSVRGQVRRSYDSSQALYIAGKCLCQFALIEGLRTALCHESQCVGQVRPNAVVPLLEEFPVGRENRAEPRIFQNVYPVFLQSGSQELVHRKVFRQLSNRHDQRFPRQGTVALPGLIESFELPRNTGGEAAHHTPVRHVDKHVRRRSRRGGLPKIEHRHITVRLMHHHHSTTTNSRSKTV
mmetsp:Transcript_9258/g.25955  ORF Transcript_9258/g.25955 Transcript_9258/m.25955 type:complete len:428 (-) Transcript_9258:468-1751(-)